MVDFWIKKIGGEKNGKIIKEYEFIKGLNIIQSEVTKRGKSTLMGVIDYCLNSDNSVFPWNPSKKYDSVFIIISINEKDYLIRRKLNEETGTIKIFSGNNFEESIEKEITPWFIELMGINFTRTAWGDSSSEVSIRDYLRLFFIRQLDTQNPIGNPFGFNKVVQAGKIVFGLEEKGKLEVQKNEKETKIAEKQIYLDQLKNDLGDLSYFSKEKLDEKKDKLNTITVRIVDFEKKLSASNNRKLPLNDKIVSIEKQIRILEDKKRELEDRQFDLKLLKNDLEKDKTLIRQTEVAINILNKYPDETCPECNGKIEDNNIYCTLCGQKIEDQKQLISNFYILNQNNKKDILQEEKLLQKEILEIADKIGIKRGEYESVYLELKDIENNSILRFTREIRNQIDERDSLVKEIMEIEIKNGYLEKIQAYESEINKIKNDIKDIEKNIEELSSNLTIFKDHQEYTTNYLKILDTSYQKIEWVDENIFPRIDDKAFIKNTGGSNSAGILLAVLTSLFNLTVNAKVKLPALLIIDSLRKHETELKDLSNISSEWEKILNVGGQMIVTGIELPENLIQLARSKGKLFYISKEEYTL